MYWHMIEHDSISAVVISLVDADKDPRHPS
jgi:hypothetical protein